MKYDTESRVSEIATTQDWMVITRILKDEWLDFRVMGLPLHSSEFVKQMITFTLTFLIVTKNGGFQRLKSSMSGVGLGARFLCQLVFFSSH